MPVYTTSICTAPHIYNLAVNVLVVDMPVYPTRREEDNPLLTNEKIYILNQNKKRHLDKSF